MRIAVLQEAAGNARLVCRHPQSRPAIHSSGKRWERAAELVCACGGRAEKSKKDTRLLVLEPVSVHSIIDISHKSIQLLEIYCVV